MGYKDMTYKDWYDFDPKDAEIDRLRAELDKMEANYIRANMQRNEAVARVRELEEVIKPCIRYIEWMGGDREPHPQQQLLDNAHKALANSEKEV